MLTAHDVLFGLGLPALVSVVLFFIDRRKIEPAASRPMFWRSRVGESVGFAIGIGFLWGCSALGQSPSIPPKEAIDCLYLAAAALLAILAIHRFLWKAGWFWKLATLFILAGTCCGIFALLPETTWPREMKIAGALACWLAAAVLTLNLGYLWRALFVVVEIRLGRIAAAAILSAMAAAVLGMSGSQTYGQIAAILPAVLVPWVVLAIALRTELTSNDLAPMFVLLFGGMLLCGYLFADLTAVNALLLFFSPLALWLGEVPIIRRWKNWQQTVLGLLVVLVPAGIALGLAFHKFLIDMADFSGM